MRIAVLMGLLVLGSCSVDKLYQARQQRKAGSFEQVGFDDLARLYVDKQTVDEVEGIYSVSGIIIKKSKGLFLGEEKEKIIEQKDNYSKVAIFRDHQKSDREYFEVSLDKEGLPSYSIRGEFNKVAEGNILVYKHFEPRNTQLYLYLRCGEEHAGRHSHRNQWQHCHHLQADISEAISKE